MTPTPDKVQEALAVFDGCDDALWEANAGGPSSSEIAAAKATLTAALAERERDAARYRWLRDKSAGQWQHPIAVSQERTEYSMRYVGPLAGQSLDAAIDAAMKDESHD